MEERMEERQGLTGSTLKIIAMVTMFIDHLGASLLENGIMRRVSEQSVLSADVAALDAYSKWNTLDWVLRGVGRLAFPIFCFLLVEGFIHTRDWRKYFARLFVFSLISEIPFDLAFYREWFYWKSQNVFFTLWIAVLVLAAVNYFEKREDLAPAGRWLLQAGAALAGIALAGFLHTDYSGFGVAVIVLLYLFRRNRKSQAVVGACAFLWEITAPLAFLPIYYYNGKRGLQLKYVFYVFYPAHLLLLGLLIKFCF